MKAPETLSSKEAKIEWSVYMQRAIDLAGRVLSATPNPRVGCVIVKNEEIVGEGWHVAAGHAHAEVMAIANAKERAQGATAFVTLEPCSFTGRTGPCSKALIDAGLEKVVIAGLDPDSRVLGNGVKDLEQAGIEVFRMDEFEAQARALNPGYFKRHETGMPFVRLKLAMSLDGRTALANGESRWISSPDSRAEVQRMRASSSAIVTGINTVLTDDPSLNVRPGELGLSKDELKENEHCLSQQPLRVVLDSQMQTPGTAKLIGISGKVKIFTTEKAETTSKLADNVEIITIDSDEKGVNLKSVLESLASEFACNDVLIEAGPTLGGGFLDRDLVDELVVFIAPKILGSDAKPLFELSGLTSLAESKQFQLIELVQIGSDIKAVLKRL